jgi:hypothetical protein
LKGGETPPFFSLRMKMHLLLLGTVAVNVCLSGGALAQTQGGGDAQPDAYTYNAWTARK